MHMQLAHREIERRQSYGNEISARSFTHSTAIFIFFKTITEKITKTLYIEHNRKFTKGDRESSCERVN